MYFRIAIINSYKYNRKLKKVHNEVLYGSCHELFQQFVGLIACLFCCVNTGCGNEYPGIMVVSGLFQTFRELSKILSRNLRYAEIILLTRISSWNFVHVPNAMLWAHVHSFSLEFSLLVWFLPLYIFARSFYRARESLVKHTRGHAEFLSK